MALMMIGMLRPGLQAAPNAAQAEVEGFLGRSFHPVPSAAVLHDAHGRSAGLVIMVERSDRDRALGLLEQSPCLQAALYADIPGYAFASELGAL